MKKNKKNICSICGKKYEGYGNNAQPINNGRCCDECNRTKVLARRYEIMLSMIFSNNLK